MPALEQGPLLHQTKINSTTDDLLKFSSVRDESRRSVPGALIALC